MDYAVWVLIVGGLLISMTVTNSLVQRLPLSAAMIYLAVGFTIGPAGLDISQPEPGGQMLLLERIVEIALLISLFSAGLKLRQPLANSRWRLSLRLALLGVFVSVAAIVPIALLFGFPFGIALLLAVAISPTDPVLAADVHVENASDRDRLRFSLTGESSLNDGIALPLVGLALQFIAVQNKGESIAQVSIWNWFLLDCVWGIGAGIVIGVVCGWLTSRVVLYLRTEQKEAIGLDEFLVLGLIALAYGFAVLAHASPFLAVLCAGLAVGHTAENIDDSLPTASIEQLDALASSRQHAAPLMMRALRGFNEQLERIAEVVIVVLAGALLAGMVVGAAAMVICAYTLFVARPVSVGAALIGARVTATQLKLMAWFGVRGVGSIYYALYALNHGVPAQWWDEVLSIVFFTCAISIFVHGISVTPLMNYYRKKTPNA